MHLATASVMYGAGLETAIDEAGRLNLHGIDIWVTPGMGEHLPPDPTPRRLAAVRQRVQDNDLVVSALTAFGVHDPVQGLDTLLQHLEVAAALEAAVVVTGEGALRGAEPLGLRAYLDYLAPALDRAAELGLTLALENHRGGHWLGRVDRTLELFDAGRHRALGLALAHHHYVVEGDDPMAALEALGDRVALVYAWDWATETRPPRDWRDPAHQMIGTGDLPWDEYLAQLAEREFAGPVVIFAHGCEDRWDAARTSAAVEEVKVWIESHL